MKITHICLSGLYMDGWGYQDNMLAKYHKKAGHEVSVIANDYVYDEQGNYKKLENNPISVTTSGHDALGNETTVNTSFSSRFIDCNGVTVYRLLQKGAKLLKGPAERVHYQYLFETLRYISPDIIFLHNPQIMDIEDIVKYIELENAYRTCDNSKASENDKTAVDETQDSLTPVRLFVDSHSDYSNSGRNFLSKHILHGMLWRSKVQKLVPYTEKFYGVLPARVDFLLDRYHTPQDKTELLCMGMDTELALKANESSVISDLRSKLNINKDDFFIITGGKIDAAKRQTLLLMEAVNKINNPHLKLVVFGSVIDEMKEEFDALLSNKNNNVGKVGDDNKSNETARIHNGNISNETARIHNGNISNETAIAHNGNKINYIGWLDSDDTYPYFAACDMAIFPGRHSVMWEQVAGQGIPMAVKYWDGTTHVDVGGNVKFLYKDSVDEIKELIESLMNKGSEYEKMKTAALQNGPKHFSYEEIAKRCIE